MKLFMDYICVVFKTSTVFSALSNNQVYPGIMSIKT